jgi:hypothetical protein
MRLPLRPRPKPVSRPEPGRRGLPGRTLGRCVAAAGLVVGLAFAQAGLAEERSSPGAGDLSTDWTASSAASEVAGWVRETTDNQGLPFLVIDKIGAQVSAFDGEGRLLGVAPVLLGLTPGDVSPPGIGDRPLSAITAGERITPAGRFLASMGENLGGKGILWIDYDAALSLHPVITTRAADRRLQRLATASAEDNRISYGCVNVPVKFYDQIVEPAFNGTMGVVYILPEHGSPAELFFRTPDLTPSTPAQAGAPLD